MKYLFLLCAIFCANLWSATNQVAYLTSTNLVECGLGHFSLALPNYWSVIPSAEIKKYQDKLKESFPNKEVPNYVFGLQRKSLYNFALPYLLVEFEQRSSPSTAEIISEANTFASAVNKTYLPLHRLGMFGEVKAMQAHYDPQKQVVIGYSQMLRASDKVRLRNITAIFPCKEGYMRFNFFANMKFLQRDIDPIFEIIESIKFDAGYQYISHDKKYGTDGAWRKGLGIFVICLASIWFALRFILRQKLKKEAFKSKQDYI